jgi:hypothetical protein
VSAAGYLFLILAAVSQTGADAGQKPVEVQFEGPTGCSGAGAFFASLRLRAAHVRAAEGDESRTTLQVRLTRERGRVVGELRTIDGSGASDTRKVQGATCDDVVQALSLTAALALDPTAVLSVSPVEADADAAASTRTATPVAASPPTPGRDKTPIVEKPPEPVSEKPQELAPVPAAIEPSPPRPVPSFEAGAGLLGLALLSGNFSPGIELEVHKNLGHGRVFHPALGLAFVYARNDVLQTPSAAAATLAAAGASACPVRVGASFLTLQPCAAMWGGLLKTAGRQLTNENSVNRLWLSAGLSLRLLAFLGHGLSLHLEGGFQSPLIRRRYFATLRRNVIAETPLLSPVVGLGLTYGF